MPTPFSTAGGSTVITTRAALDQARAALQSAPLGHERLPYGSLWPVVSVVRSPAGRLAACTLASLSAESAGHAARAGRALRAPARQVMR